MTILELICILCAAGWAISLLSVILIVIAGGVIAGKKTSIGVNIVCAILILTFVGGFVGCAAEDRVCEAADR